MFWFMEWWRGDLTSLNQHRQLPCAFDVTAAEFSPAVFECVLEHIDPEYLTDFRLLTVAGNGIYLYVHLWFMQETILMMLRTAFPGRNFRLIFLLNAVGFGTVLLVRRNYHYFLFSDVLNMQPLICYKVWNYLLTLSSIWRTVVSFALIVSGIFAGVRFVPVKNNTTKKNK